MLEKEVMIEIYFQLEISSVLSSALPDPLRASGFCHDIAQRTCKSQ